MAVVLGLVVALVVLYLWLSGHWFGRVVAFLAFGAVACLPLLFDLWTVADKIVATAIGLGVAWLLASVPHLWRRKTVNGRVEGAVSGFGNRRLPQLVVNHVDYE